MFDSKLAGEAIVDGLVYLQGRLKESMFENPVHQCAWLATIHPEMGLIPENLMSESMD